MKTSYLIPILTLFIVSISCKSNSTIYNSKEATVVKAQKQYETLFNLTENNKNTSKIFPRTTKAGEVSFVSPYDWTSGFYPGSLWYLYMLSNDSKWKSRAIQYTEALDTIQYWKGNHDVGFMMECSYGNALKSIDSKAYDKIIVQTAKSLSSRFHPKAGIIQSWNSSEKWNCPVIIDNMMNLELLFHATKISKDSSYYNIAVSHANSTIANHFRSDNSSYHVLNYNTETGEILNKNTHQGYADNSAWSRGQAWGLYGFTVTYRETQNKAYLEQAIKIANFIMKHPQLPEDKIPYWDYNAPIKEDTPRDASAAAITASALYELSGYVSEIKKSEYLSLADAIIKSLGSSNYFAQEGENKGFLLLHSVGSLPHESEVDVPLNYADYYFLEALYRSNSIN